METLSTNIEPLFLLVLLSTPLLPSLPVGTYTCVSLLCVYFQKIHLAVMERGGKLEILLESVQLEETTGCKFSLLGSLFFFFLKTLSWWFSCLPRHACVRVLNMASHEWGVYIGL